MWEEDDLTKQELTKKEHLLYIQVVKYIKQYGIAPTLRELADKVGISHEGARIRLQSLDRKGYVVLGKGPRNISLVGYSFRKD